MALLLHGLGFDVTLFTPTFAGAAWRAGLGTRGSSNARTGSFVRSRRTRIDEAEVAIPYGIPCQGAA